MTTWRVAALLLGINAVVFVVGVALSGASPGADRPGWLPPAWFRAAVPLIVAFGLWFGHRWAWGVGIVLCFVLLLWTGLASLVLALGGYFAGPGARSLPNYSLGHAHRDMAGSACFAPVAASACSEPPNKRLERAGGGSRRYCLWLDASRPAAALDGCGDNLE